MRKKAEHGTGKAGLREVVERKDSRARRRAGRIELLRSKRTSGPRALAVSFYFTYK